MQLLENMHQGQGMKAVATCVQGNCGSCCRQNMRDLGAPFKTRACTPATFVEGVPSRAMTHAMPRDSYSIY